VAIATMMAVPTIAGPIPPPFWPNWGRSLVRKLQLSASAPFLKTDQTTTTRTATATTAASVADAWTIELMTARRRRLPVGVSGDSGSNGRGASSSA
jgi:hypothetical protein